MLLFTNIDIFVNVLSGYGTPNLLN